MKYLAIYLLLVGCAGSVVNDPVLPAIEANYPTAEFRACEKHWLGSGVCRVENGFKYSDIDLKVQVYYRGTLSVTSRDCQLDVHLTYDGTQLIPITIPGTAERDCLISITVSPIYPNNDNDPIRVYSFRGYLALRQLEPEKNWKGFVRKVTGDFSSQIKIWVGGTNNIRLVASGCGRDEPVDLDMELTNGYLLFDLDMVIPGGMLPKTCVVTGFVRSGFPDVLFNVLVSKYDPRFVPLPIPDVKLEGLQIRIISDAAVSVIALNDKFEISNYGRFTIDIGDENFIRALTTGGRSVLGIWSVADKTWGWQQ